MKKFRAFCALVLCLSIFTSMINPLNANAQAFPKHLEKEFREDATLQVSKAVKIYMDAKSEFEKKGAVAFAERLNTLSPKTFTQSEKTFLAKKIAKELLLPELVIKGDRLIGMEGKKEIFNLDTLEVAQGVFTFQDKKLIYNSNKRLIENYESWENVQKQSFLNLLFLPQAHAFSKKTGLIVGLVLGGLIGALWPKISQWFKGKQETPIPLDTHSGAIPAATPQQASTTATENPPAGALPSPPPADQAGNAGTTATGADGGNAATPSQAAATTTNTAKLEIPKIDESKPDTQIAVDYIVEKHKDREVNTLEDIRKEQKSIDYPIFACSILRRARADLEARKISKTTAGLIYKILIEDEKQEEIKQLNSHYYKPDPSKADTVSCSVAKEELKKDLSL